MVVATAQPGELEAIQKVVCVGWLLRVWGARSGYQSRGITSINLLGVIEILANYRGCCCLSLVASALYSLSLTRFHVLTLHSTPPQHFSRVGSRVRGN